MDVLKFARPQSLTGIIDVGNDGQAKMGVAGPYLQNSPRKVDEDYYAVST